MSFLLFILIGALLFTLAFITRRRFGVLVLGLCAGVVLSDVLTTSVMFALQAIGASIPGIPTGMLASSILVVIPSLVLMVGGPRYHTKRMAIVGGLAYSVFALLLLLLPMQGAIALGETSGQIVDTALSYRSPIIAIVVLIALFDVLTIHATKLDKRRKH